MCFYFWQQYNSYELENAILIIDIIMLKLDFI